MTAIYRGYDQQGLDAQYERLVAPHSYAIFDCWRARRDLRHCAVIQTTADKGSELNMRC